MQSLNCGQLTQTLHQFDHVYCLSCIYRKGMCMSYSLVLCPWIERLFLSIRLPISVNEILWISWGKRWYSFQKKVYAHGISRFRHLIE